MYYSLGGGAELRLLEERHAAELFALVDKNRARLRRWLPWLDASTQPAHTQAFIHHALELFAHGRGATAGIFVDGAIAGVIDHHDLSAQNRSVAIGYWLAAAHEGRGLVTRAATAMVRRAFGEIGLNRVEIRAAVGNDRSRAVARRLGFREEGTLRDISWLYDRFLDEVVYSMLAREWTGA
jgi:ribosomal-protein-serine acetyltransferase